MTAAVQTWAGNTTGSTTSLTINKPTGVQSGDFLIAYLVTQNNNGNPWSSSGWTNSGGSSGSGGVSILTKVAGGSEPTTYTFTCTGSNASVQGTILRISGHNPTTPINVLGVLGNTAASATTIVLPSVTITGADEVLLLNIGELIDGNNRSVDPPAGTTEIYDERSGSGTNTRFAGTSLQAPGSTGTRTWTVSSGQSAAHRSGALIAINSAVPGASTPGKIKVTYLANNTFTVPTGVTSITVECVGGGGGGGTGAVITAGGGGGGGAYAKSVLTVTPGSTHSVVVGAGGAATKAGALSSFGTGPLVRGAAGAQGGNASTLAAGSGGAGGSVANSIGATRNAGTNGASGGAGGAGGTPLGGAGGAANGGAGTAPGGGGGGGSILNGTGGAGAGGLVIVEFEYATEEAVTSDTYQMVVDWKRSFNETVTSVDAIAKTFLMPETETVTATDAIVKLITMPEVESLTATDALTRLISFLRPETLTASDFIAKLISMPEVETLTASDFIVKAISMLEPESVTASDALTKAIFLLRSESVLTTDVFTRILALLKQDQVATSDFITKALLRTIPETLTATDLITKNIYKPVVESVTTSDFAFIVLIFLRYFDDPVTASDLISKYVQMGKTDVAVPVDDQFKIIFKRPLLESVTATDTAYVVATYNRLFTDSVTTSDALSRRFSVNFADSISGSVSVAPTGRRIFAVLSD